MQQFIFKFPDFIDEIEPFYFERVLFVVGDAFERLKLEETNFEKLKDFTKKLYKFAVNTVDNYKKIALTQFLLANLQFLEEKRQIKLFDSLYFSFVAAEEAEKIMILRNIEGFDLPPAFSEIFTGNDGLVPRFNQQYELTYLQVKLLGRMKLEAVSKELAGRIVELVDLPFGKQLKLIFELVGNLAKTENHSKICVEKLISVLQRGETADLAVEQLVSLVGKEKQAKFIILYCIKSFYRSTSDKPKSRIVYILKENFSKMPNTIVEFIRKIVSEGLEKLDFETKTMVFD